MTRFRLSAALAASLLFLLPACGQKGPLFKPGTKHFEGDWESSEPPPKKVSAKPNQPQKAQPKQDTAPASPSADQPATDTPYAQ